MSLLPDCSSDFHGCDSPWIEFAWPSENRLPTKTCMHLFSGIFCDVRIESLRQAEQLYAPRNANGSVISSGGKRLATINHQPKPLPLKKGANKWVYLFLFLFFYVAFRRLMANVMINPSQWHIQILVKLPRSEHKNKVPVLTMLHNYIYILITLSKCRYTAN